MARSAVDLFPDPILLDPVDENHHEELLSSVQLMLSDSNKAVLIEADSKQLDKIVKEHIEYFLVSVSHGSAAKIIPFRINLTPEALPVRVKLRNYSQEQKEFLKKFLNDLVHHDMGIRSSIVVHSRPCEI